MVTRLIVVLPALWALMMGSPLGAQSFSVSAEIVPGCVVSNSAQTSGIDFGALVFGTHPATTVGPTSVSTSIAGGGALGLECTGGLALNVSVDGGLHADGSSRRLAAPGGATIPYTLFANSGLSVAIPLVGEVGIVVPTTGLLDVPIHAVAYLPGAGQAPGAYADTLAVTLSW